MKFIILPQEKGTMKTNEIIEKLTKWLKKKGCHWKV